MAKDLPVLLRYLAETYNYRVQQRDMVLGYEVYQVDLSSLKLSITEQTTVLRVRDSDLGGKSPGDIYESIQDAITQSHLNRQIVIVLVDGDGAPLHQLFRRSYQRIAVVDATVQEAVRKSRRPIGEFLDAITTQISLSTLAPYETRSPVSGSRFFGREFEIAKVLDHPDTNYAILGIRRIGKTSMLHQIARELGAKQNPKEISNDEQHQPIVYLDCSDLDTSNDFVREVVRRLSTRELLRLERQQDPWFFFPNFLERMRHKYQTRIVFLLDEIDNLLVRQRGTWDLLRMMRASFNQKSCQYVVAGFSEALKEQQDQNSPFFNFAEEIRLNEFTRRQASDLIVTPMEYLRIRFRNREEVVARIYDETAGLPNLIQYYCAILLKRLDETGRREIDLDSLIDVYGNEGFRSHLVDSFLTNTRNREKCVVYAILGELGSRWRAAFSQEFIDDALQKRGLTLPHTELTDACSVLVLAGILHRKGSDYSFTSPVFIKVLQQSSSIEYLFRKAQEEGL
jgi:Cdc6-like AAA superfamily ATPase